MVKLFISYIFISSYILAGNICTVDPSILKIIAFTEKHVKRPAGYEYLISFNNKKDAKEIQKELGKRVFLDNRTIDCKNMKLCTDITTYLVKQKKIYNLDLGAFQLNYKYKKMKIKNYFSFSKSYEKACAILNGLIDKYGYSWKSIARYHSGTPKYNYAYLEKISQILGEKKYAFKK